MYKLQILCLVFVVVRCSGLGCGTLKPSLLESFISQADEISNYADEILVPKQFARVEHGILYVELNEGDGEDNGGATNTDGSYGKYVFKSAKILPEGVCDVTTYNRQPRCSQMGNTGSFMLGPSDAIVFVGCTPPPMRYFSFDIDIGTRFDNNGYPFHPGVNFGDTVNIRNIGNDGVDATAYNKPIIVIHTADNVSASQIRTAFIGSGNFSTSSIAIHSLDSDTIRTWNRQGGLSWNATKPDIFESVVRLSVPLPGYEEQYKLYRKMPWPVRFYFKDDEAIAVDPFVPKLKSRYSDEVIDETQVFGDSILELELAVIEAHKKSFNLSHKSTVTVNFTVTGFYDDWDTILAMQSNDTFVIGVRDALYGLPAALPYTITTPSMLYQQGSYAVAIGIQHVDVIGAAYNSVGVDVVNGYGTIFSSQWFIDSDLRGSASRYISSNPQHENLFAIDFRPPNECNDSPFCVEFNYSSLRFDEQSFYLWICERVYSVEKTQVGPAYNKTIGARLLIFEPAASGNW